jgi:hypothetical protein
MAYEISPDTPDVSAKNIGRNIRQDMKPKSFFFIDNNIGFTQNPVRNLE